MAVIGRAIGLDVHLDFCEVAIVEAGELRSAGRIETTPERLKLFAGSLGPQDWVALEVTGNAWEIARILEPHVAKVIVVSPADTGIRQARAKTDRLDARTLARLLAAGELDAVWTPDEWTRVMRRRLSRREQLVRSRSRAKDEIHAVLMRRLKGRPPVSDLFGVKGPALATRVGVSRRGARDGRWVPAPHRVPRPGDRAGRAADRHRGT
jgi:transposase